jgi:hypothetical protein
MLIIDEHKLAFAFPAKTGSTTAVQFLSNFKGDVTVLPQKHHLPKDVVKNYPQIKNYRVFCFLRNPVDRFVSALSMFNGGYFSDLLRVIKNSDDLDVDGFLKKYFLGKFLGDLKPDDPKRYIFMPQIGYLDECDVVALDFDNYESELRKVTKDLGLDEYEVSHSNKSKDPDLYKVKSKFVEFVKNQYQDDCELWVSQFGRQLC